MAQVNGMLEVVWDTPEAEQVVKKRLDFVLTGCGCKTGCTNKRCKCLKQQQACGPGCRCVGCRNSHKSLSLVRVNTTKVVLWSIVT